MNLERRLVLELSTIHSLTYHVNVTIVSMLVCIYVSWLVPLCTHVSTCYMPGISSCSDIRYGLTLLMPHWPINTWWWCLVSTPSRHTPSSYHHNGHHNNARRWHTFIHTHLSQCHKPIGASQRRPSIASLIVELTLKVKLKKTNIITWTFTKTVRWNKHRSL